MVVRVTKHGQASDLLCRVRAAGFEVLRIGNKVRVRGETKIPNHFGWAIKEHKPTLLRILADEQRKRDREFISIEEGPGRGYGTWPESVGMAIRESQARLQQQERRQYATNCLALMDLLDATGWPALRVAWHTSHDERGWIALMERHPNLIPEAIGQLRSLLEATPG